MNRKKPEKINKSLPINQREGQIGINNQGLEMKITRHSKLEGERCYTIDIEFLIDGYKSKNRDYFSFLLGSIKNPNFPDANFIDRTGQRRQNNNGDWMTITEYYGYKSIVVTFDDDGSKKTSNCSNFDNGTISHPLRFTESLYYNYPEVAKAIANEKNGITLEDTEHMSCTYGSFYIKCPNCGRISSKKKTLSRLTKRGLSCEYCSDGISIPNKMLRQIAKQLSLNWEFEYSEDWMGKKRFDAYDIDLKQPIEADCFYYDNHKGKRKEVDNWKDEQAVSHDMKLPIRIDLMDKDKYYNNTLEYIKQQIYLAIGDLYNLDKVDWELAFINSQNSLMIEACRLWDEEKIYSTGKIGSILGLHYSTISRYLKRGYKLGLCDYTRDKSNKERCNKRKSINNNTSILYWVIKSNGEKYLDRPLCKNEIYNCNSKKGFLNIGEVSFKKYIEPYNNINIELTRKIKARKDLIEKLTPFDGWQFIPLSKEEKQQYLESIK